jgi:hypothetical protein
MKGCSSAIHRILLQQQTQEGVEVKKILFTLTLALLMAVLSIQLASAAGPEKQLVTFKLLGGLPRTMQIGQSYTVTVQVDSSQEFISAQAMPDDQYPGKGVISNGVSHTAAGTSATMIIVFTAKSSTRNLPGGTDQVAVVAGVRLPNGQIVTQRFDFSVVVP